jgi:hypothetical protein
MEQYGNGGCPKVSTVGEICKYAALMVVVGIVRTELIVNLYLCTSQEMAEQRTPEIMGGGSHAKSPGRSMRYPYGNSLVIILYIYISNVFSRIYHI